MPTDEEVEVVVQAILQRKSPKPGSEHYAMFSWNQVINIVQEAITALDKHRGGEVEPVAWRRTYGGVWSFTDEPEVAKAGKRNGAVVEPLYSEAALSARVEELKAGLEDCAEHLEVALGRLGVTLHGDGKDHRADQNSWGATASLARARALLSTKPAARPSRRIPTMSSASNVVFLHKNIGSLEDDTMAFLSCRNCKNKTYTITCDKVDEFSLLRCAACQAHIGRIGWAEENDHA